MSKYLYGFKLYFLDAFHYRFNTVVTLIFSGLSMMVTIFFWFLIYGGDTEAVINGFSFSGIVTFFVIGSIFRTYHYPGFMFAGMIKSGELGPTLLKPLNLGVSVYFRSIAGMLTGMIPQILFVLCIIPFAARFLVWELTFVNAVFLFAFFVAGTLSNFLVWSIFGFMAFWLEEAQSIMWSFAVMCNLLTGFFIPLAFFPAWSVPILEVLPFSSWSYIPTLIYMGMFSFERMVFLLFAHVGWVAVLLVLNKLVWHRGIRRFSSVGG